MLPASLRFVSSSHCRPPTHIPTCPPGLVQGGSFPVGQSSCPTGPLEAHVCHVTPNSCFKNPLQYHIHQEPFQLPQRIMLVSVTSQHFLDTSMSEASSPVSLSRERSPKLRAKYLLTSSLAQSPTCSQCPRNQHKTNQCKK